MDKWNRDTSLDPDNLCKDMNNLILLRSDLHTVFDERIFVLFPKSDKGFVVHMLEQSPDLAQLYHNVEVHPLQCSPYFIFARFAWALFPSLSGFLSRPNVSRYLRILKTSSTGAEYIEEEVIGAAKLQATLSASRSRSPKKRQRAAEQQDNNTEDGTTRSRKKQRRGSESSSEPSVEISREDFERMNIPRTSWTADQRLKYTKMELSEEQLAKIELEEDLEFQREKFPHFAEFGHPNNPPAWYPGWRRVQRLKNSWVAETRPPSFIDKREDTNSESMEKDVTRFYESIGVEILDDLDSVCMDSVCMDSVC
jgi:hypothetical protein